jgi:hypothetical protein
MFAASVDEDTCNSFLDGGTIELEKVSALTYSTFSSIAHLCL